MFSIGIWQHLDWNKFYQQYFSISTNPSTPILRAHCALGCQQGVFPTAGGREVGEWGDCNPVGSRRRPHCPGEAAHQYWRKCQCMPTQQHDSTIQCCQWGISGCRQDADRESRHCELPDWLGCNCSACSSKLWAYRCELSSIAVCLHLQPQHRTSGSLSLSWITLRSQLCLKVCPFQ